MWKKFTEPGEPGELLRPHYESMAAHLLDQGRMVGTGMVSEPQNLASSKYMTAAKLSSDDSAILCVY